MSRTHLLTIAAALCAAAPLHAEAPLLAVPGRVVYESTLAAAPAAPWRAAKGKWEAAEGVLRGAELPEDKHGAVLRMMGPVGDNVVIEYQFRLLDGVKGTTISINGVKDHVCRLMMTSKSFTVQKDDSDHDGPDKAIVFSRQAADLRPGEWHSVRMEIIGGQMLGKCGDLVGHGSHDLMATKKMNLGFTVAGQSVEFRNLKISEATLNPKWEEVKATLPKGKELPAPAKKGKKVE